MSSRAHVELDLLGDGIKLAVSRRDGSGQMTGVQVWSGNRPITRQVTDPAAEPQEDVWLHLWDDDARAIYEALADYFGHSGHDTRALRRDYDEERKRVDRMLGALIHLTGRSD